MVDLTRRRALALAGTALAGGFAGCQSGGDDTDTDGPTPDGTPTPGTADGASPADGTTSTEGTPTPTDGTDSPERPPLSDLSVSAERVASGFTSPVAVEIPSPGRRFVVDQPGRVYLHDSDGLHEEPFLDVADRLVEVSGYSERGLLGLAVHPDFESNGRFFVRYSAPSRAGTPDGYSHTFVLSEFSADPDATRADPDSERTVMEIPQPQGNHNAGDLAFGPDGRLYVAVGDGGGAGDRGTGHVEDWYDGNPGGNGQDVTANLLGSMLRIDVDGNGSVSPSDGGESVRDYTIPDGNPLVGQDGLDEHYAWGLRNPWRFSFGPDGRLFAADVGQSAYEEVAIVERGGNYGWNVREATHCFGAEECPTESPRGRPLRDPVVEYPHGGQPVSGIAVIGGYLYDGDDLPGFRDRYVFADWRAGGRLFVADEQADGLWPTAAVPVDVEGFGPNVLSFGRNPAGELFVTTTARGSVSGETGALYRLRPA